MQEIVFDRFYIEKEDFEKYKEIENRSDSILRYHPEVFLLSAVIGYKYSLREPIKNKTQLVHKTSVLNLEFGELIYEAFKLIAEFNDERNEEGNLKVNTIMEEYAKGGFSKLYNEILREKDEANESNLVNYLMLYFE